jgi:hypothetical protein
LLLFGTISFGGDLLAWLWKWWMIEEGQKRTTTTTCKSIGGAWVM